MCFPYVKIRWNEVVHIRQQGRLDRRIWWRRASWILWKDRIMAGQTTYIFLNWGLLYMRNRMFFFANISWFLYELNPMSNGEFFTEALWKLLGNCWWHFFSLIVLLLERTMVSFELKSYRLSAIGAILLKIITIITTYWDDIKEKKKLNERRKIRITNWCVRLGKKVLRFHVISENFFFLKKKSVCEAVGIATSTLCLWHLAE